MQQWIDREQTIQNIINVLDNNDNIKIMRKVFDVIKKEPCLNSENCDMLKGYAQKPKNWTDDFKDYYFCPVCEHEDGLKQGQNYCDCCGQKINWNN